VPFCLDIHDRHMQFMGVSHDNAMTPPSESLRTTPISPPNTKSTPRTSASLQSVTANFIGGKELTLVNEEVVVVVVSCGDTRTQNWVLATLRPFWTVTIIAGAGQNSKPPRSVWLSLRRQLLSSDEGKGNSWCRF
jgi:hypothetical protein